MGIFRSDNEVPCHSSITIDRATRCDWKLWTSTSVLCCYFLLWSKVVLGPLTTFEFLAFFDIRRWFWKRNIKKVLVGQLSLDITVLRTSSLNGGVRWILSWKRSRWLFVGTRRYPTRRTSVLSKHPWRPSLSWSSPSEWSQRWHRTPHRLVTLKHLIHFRSPDGCWW